MRAAVKRASAVQPVTRLSASRSAQGARVRLLSSNARASLTCGPRWARELSYDAHAARQLPAAVRALHATATRRDEVVKVPQMAESISEGTLKQWLKKKGDHVEADEEVATIETDKIDVSVNAPKAGTITETLANEDDTVTVGQDLFKLEPGEGGGSSEGSSSQSEEKSEEKTEEKPAPKEEKSEEPKQEESKESSKNNSAAPAGGERKKSESDLKNKEEHPQQPEAQHKSDDKRPEAAKSKSTSEKPPQPKSDEKSEPAISKPTPGERRERRVKMNRMRMRIAERLKQSQNTAAALTTFNEIDMSSLMEMRKLYKDDILKNHGVKLGFMSAFSRAAALALQEIPAVNAAIEGNPGEQIVYRDYVDISVAVATPKGLVTPVIRNIETMNFVQIEQAIADAGKKARDGKLGLEEMSGGTFTISNGGVFGSLFGTPIINLPQTAVLGLHAVKDKAWVVNGEIKIRPIMVVALTYDHRLVDGREAVMFLVKIKEYIEDPRRMLLSVV